MDAIIEQKAYDMMTEVDFGRLENIEWELNE